MSEIGKSVVQNNRLLAGICAIACIVLLMRVVPRFIASLYALYPESVLQQALQETDRPLSEEILHRSGADLDNALVWFASAEYWQNLAILHTLQENSLAISSEEDLLPKSKSEIINGLKLSPVDSFAWYSLATVDDLLGAEPESVLDSIRLSIYAGRVDQGLLLPRLALAFSYVGEFDEEMEALIKGQIRLAWAFQRQGLVEFTADQPDFLIWVNDALINSPDDSARFLHDLENFNQKNKPPRATE